MGKLGAVLSPAAINTKGSQAADKPTQDTTPPDNKHPPTAEQPPEVQDPTNPAEELQELGDEKQDTDIEGDGDKLRDKETRETADTEDAAEKDPVGLERTTRLDGNDWDRRLGDGGMASWRTPGATAPYPTTTWAGNPLPAFDPALFGNFAPLMGVLAAAAPELYAHVLQNLASNTQLSLPLQQQYQALSQQVNGQLYGQPSIPGTAPAYATQVTNGQGLPGYNAAGPGRGAIGIGGQTVNNAHAVAGQITGPGVAANAQARPEGMNAAQQPATQTALPGRPVANAAAAPGVLPASQLPLSVLTQALQQTAPGVGVDLNALSYVTAMLGNYPQLLSMAPARPWYDCLQFLTCAHSKASYSAHPYCPSRSTPPRCGHRLRLDS